MTRMAWEKGGRGKQKTESRGHKYNRGMARLKLLPSKAEIWGGEGVEGPRYHFGGSGSGSRSRRSGSGSISISNKCISITKQYFVFIAKKFQYPDQNIENYDTCRKIKQCKLELP
jgi:hypothetical protein